MPIEKVDKREKPLTSEHPDNRYIKAIIENDRAVLKEIYATYVPIILHFVRSNSGTTEEAHDIFQEAIIIIYKKATGKGLVIQSSFKNYIYTVCRNLWMQVLQRKGRLRVTSIDHIIENGDSLVESLSLTEEIEQRESHKLYLEKFGELSKDCQRVLRSFFQGMSMRAIAQEMGYASEAYAKKRKHICQKRLIEAIKKDPRYKIIKG